MRRHSYLEVLRRIELDLCKKLPDYLEALERVARSYGGRAYVFGSLVRGERIAASDVDVLIVIPSNVDRLEVLHQARRAAPNPRIELHIVHEGWEEEAYATMTKPWIPASQAARMIRQGLLDPCPYQA